ncbi:MAG: hypothetical protein ACYCV7_06915 [Acidimicrobiales bacterium]
MSTTSGVVDFQISYPGLVLPFLVNGDILGANTLASGFGEAQGIAGPAPVPIATSLGLIIPNQVPLIGYPIPPQIQQALKSVNYSALPNYCQSNYPVFQGEHASATCGGPSQTNPALGLTVDGMNGSTTSSGNPNNPLATTSVSQSQASDIGIPALQYSVSQAQASSSSQFSSNGLPQATAENHASGMSFLGGLVNFKGITSNATVTTDGTPAGTATSTGFSVSSISVAGVPVTVGANGVSADQTPVGLPASALATPSALVNKTLAAAGVSMTLVPARVVDAAEGATATSAGIVFTENTPPALSAIPEMASKTYYRVGFASAQADASSSSTSGGSGGGSTSGGSGGGSTSGGGSFSSGGGSGLGLGGGGNSAIPSSAFSSPGISSAPTSASTGQPTSGTGSGNGGHVAATQQTHSGNQSLLAHETLGPLAGRDFMPWVALLVFAGLVAVMPGRKLLVRSALAVRLKV